MVEPNGHTKSEENNQFLDDIWLWSSRLYQVTGSTLIIARRAIESIAYWHLFYLNVEKFVFLDSMNDFKRIHINPDVMNKWAIFESMAKKRTINQRVQMRRSRSQLFLSSFFLFLSQLVKFMESKAKYLSTSPILSVLDWPLSTILTVNF